MSWNKQIKLTTKIYTRNKQVSSHLLINSRIYITNQLMMNYELSQIKFNSIQEGGKRKKRGVDSSNYFNGTFDGQGHVISDLKMTSSSQYVGVFGISRGLTIKNVIIDSSCSITSLFSDSGTAIGGIIGLLDRGWTLHHQEQREHGECLF